MLETRDLESIFQVSRLNPLNYSDRRWLFPLPVFGITHFGYLVNDKSHLVDETWPSFGSRSSVVTTRTLVDKTRILSQFQHSRWCWRPHQLISIQNEVTIIQNYVSTIQNCHSTDFSISCLLMLEK